MPEATNLNILNAVWKVQDLNYQSRIPEATQENIGSIYENILNIVPIRNAFAEALITQIMIQRIESGYFKNPLAVLKKEPMRYGMTEEEIFVNFAKGYTFNQFAGANELYAYYKSAVMSAYHKISPAMQYAVTITYDNLRNAFTSDYGIRDLINAKVASLMSGFNWDEYIIMKEVIESAYHSSILYPVHVEKPTTEALAKELTVQMKTYIEKMKFPNPQYNIAGATSPAMENGIYYMVTPETDARLDVEVLAYAFHNDKATVDAHKIVIDKFDNPDIVAIVFDMRFFNVRENFKTLSDSKNGAALTWNYFYTVSEMFSYSPFFPIIAFTTESIGVDTITASDGTVSKGGELAITALASDDGGSSDYVPQVFDYDVSGATSSFTGFIPGSNILTVGNDEKASSLTVTVKSRYNDSVTGSCTVTVQ